MAVISSVLFLVLFAAGVTLFTINIKKIIRNVRLGKAINRSDNAPERWRLTLRVALGQSKMVTRPVAGVLHIFVYVGFVIINIEVLEMFVDGIFGTHRFLAFLGKGLYGFLIGSFEILAFLVILGCALFLIRRNIIKLKRFMNKELDGWPRTDANIILISEILLMSAFFTMNACDALLYQAGSHHYTVAFPNPVSGFLMPLFSGISPEGLIFMERFCWWFHIVGIIAFLNYLPYSKHLHILLAFPTVYFSNLNPKGQFTNPESVTNEVKLMFDPNAQVPASDGAPLRFGVKEVTDLTWKQLLDSYSCTECGRCTSSCPANQTGKLLSPRKIMMDTRDRLEEVGKNVAANKGQFVDDGKALLNDYITPEELWACTSCNACVQECPVNIDPLSIIIDMRRYLVMEQSAAPQELNLMLTNIENNGAPWQFSPADRLNWKNES
jgi:heterodisulfide reductase subunit C